MLGNSALTLVSLQPKRDGDVEMFPVCAVWADTHCHHICCWPSCIAHPPASYTTLLNKLENKMTVHLTAFLTIFVNTPCASLHQIGWHAGMIQKSSCKAPEAVESLFLLVSVDKLLWSHKIWYCPDLITQLLFLLSIIQHFKIPAKIVPANGEIINAGEKLSLLWHIYITNRWNM